MNPDLYKNVLTGRSTPIDLEGSTAVGSSSSSQATILTPVTSLVQNLQGASLEINNLHRRLSCDSIGSESDTSLSYPAVCTTPSQDDALSISPFICATRKESKSASLCESPMMNKMSEKQFFPRKSSKRILFDCTNTRNTPKSKPSTSSLKSGGSYSMFSNSESKENFLPPLSQNEKGNSSSCLSKETDSLSDDFLEDFLCVPSEMEGSKSPAVSSLMSLPLNSWNIESPKQQKGSRVAIRRCLSMFDDSTPLSKHSKKSRLPFTSVNEAHQSVTSPVRSCKRSASPLPEELERSVKRAKHDDPMPGPSCSRDIAGSCVNPPPIQRCLSESHVSIMRALTKSSESNGQELTGDFSRPVALPLLVGGRHPDLRTIDVHTLANLLKGHYNDKIATYSILDCRYPYEYDGGHIKGALNWPHPKHVLEFLNRQTGLPVIPQESGLRHIFVFHCEFSAERGPRALRLLREMDRIASKDQYPALYFPELYLLEGGYKAFYHNYPDLCDPFNYVKMVDENHTGDFKLFRAQSKSWTTENKHGKLKSMISRKRFI